MSGLIEIPLACAGHVLIDLPIFMGPVVVLSGWLLVVSRRARKRELLEGTGEALTEAPERSERRISDNLLGVHA
jgi:hypothetical protein